LERRLYGEAIEKVIEDVRSKVLDGFQSGRVTFGRGFFREPAEEDSAWSEHPTHGLFEVHDSEAFVIDDRFFNQHGTIELPSGGRPILTTFDILRALRGQGKIAEVEHFEALTRLRRAGFFLVPIEYDELKIALLRAQVIDGALQETAELKAIREYLLCVRMTDAVQLPREAQWLDGHRQSMLETLRSQWGLGIPDEISRAKSNWLVEFLDPRGWAHSFQDDGSETAQRRAAQMFLLAHIPHEDESVRDRYKDWFSQELLAPFMEHEPGTYRRLLALASAVVEAMGERSELEDESAR